MCAYIVTPAASSRTTRQILLWILRFGVAVGDVDAGVLPACAPTRCCSPRRSGRVSSTSTATCLPRPDASMSASRIGESGDVRYIVCLMASTLGSSAASSTKRATVASNDSYGWCTRMSRCRGSREERRGGRRRSRRHDGTAGVNGGSATARRLAVRRSGRGRRGRAGHVADDDVVRGQLQLFEQQFAARRRDVAAHLEATRPGEAAAPELALDQLEQVVGLLARGCRSRCCAGRGRRCHSVHLHAGEKHVAGAPR